MINQITLLAEKIQKSNLLDLHGNTPEEERNRVVNELSNLKGKVPKILEQVEPATEELPPHKND